MVDITFALSPIHVLNIVIGKCHSYTHHLQDPEKATFYFIPARCSAYRKSVSNLAEGINKAADTMNQIVEYIKFNYPYWNESLGTDHFYVCAHDMGTNLVKRSDPNLWKNSIGLVNTADSSEPMFVPHKDISLPPHPGRGSIDWAVIGQGGVPFDPKVRTKLAFMAGHPGRCVQIIYVSEWIRCDCCSVVSLATHYYLQIKHIKLTLLILKKMLSLRGPVRPQLYQLFEDDTDFHLVKGYISDEDYIL